MTRDGIRRRYVDAGWSQIHVAEVGTGPTVLLLHQTPRSWDEFREVMIELRSDLRLVAMDLPGMGSSDEHPGGASIENYALAAATVLRETATSPVTVCGHHTGGVVAMHLATIEPALVEQLVLSSTPWVDGAERAKRAGKVPVDTVTRLSDGGHLLSLWEQRAPAYGHDLATLDRFIADALRTTNPATGHHAVSAYRMEDAVPHIQCPVTIVEHSADPYASPHTQALITAFPDATIRRIPSGGVALEATASSFAGLLLQAIGSEPRSS